MGKQLLVKANEDILTNIMETLQLWGYFGEKSRVTKIIWDTLLGTNILPEKSILKMIFLFPRWDMLISWRVDLPSFCHDVST